MNLRAGPGQKGSTSPTVDEPMSSTASVTDLPLPQASTTATVVGGDASRRAHLRGLLEDAGFDVHSAAATSDDPSSESGGLVVLLCEGPALERVRLVRAAAQGRPDALVLAVLAADTPNAAMRRALLAGAAGILLDDDVDRALVATSRALLAGQLSVPSVLSRQIAPRPLSYREKQILALVVRGYTNREIAQKLFLAESTVKTHLSSAFRKVDARSRSEAVALIQDPDSGFGMDILAIASETDGPAINAG
jgi:DNA-binding NarL/FixJ family response regulator